MKNNYWSDDEEKICGYWVANFYTTKSELKYSKLYLLLSPKVDKMIYTIIQRHFHIQKNDLDDLLIIAKNHLFLNLHKYDITQNKSFSWCSTIVKKYVISELFTTPNRKKNTIIEIINGEDEYTEIFKNANEILNDDDEEGIDYDKVIQYFKQFQSKLTLKNDLIINKLIIEYIEKFENITPSLMFEYINNNSSINPSLISSFFKRHFKLQLKEKKDIIEKYNSIINDDFRPDQKNDIHHIYEKRRLKIKRSK